MQLNTLFSEHVRTHTHNKFTISLNSRGMARVECEKCLATIFRNKRILTLLYAPHVTTSNSKIHSQMV